MDDMELHQIDLSIRWQGIWLGGYGYSLMTQYSIRQ